MFIRERIARFTKSLKPETKPEPKPEYNPNSVDPVAHAQVTAFARKVFNRSKEEKKAWEKEPNYFELALKALTNKKLLPPYNKNILPTLEDLTDMNKRLVIIFMAANTITSMLESPAFAADPKNQASISWAEDAIMKIDPMEYLLYKKSERAKASPIYLFDEDDKKILTLNLYHEIRGGLSEGVEGEKSILGVLYSVFERMNSKRYGADPKSVVLAQSQYSWTLEILAGSLDKKKMDTSAYKKLRALIEKYTNMPFELAHKELKEDLEKIVNQNSEKSISLPENLNDYHLFEMLTPKKDIGQKYSKHTNTSTKARILKAEELHAVGSPLVIKLGRHLHYNAETIDELVEIK